MDDVYEFDFVYRGYHYHVRIKEGLDGRWTTTCRVYHVSIPIDETPLTSPLDAIEKGRWSVEIFLDHFIDTQQSD
jgi:hypothetical protein